MTASTSTTTTVVLTTTTNANLTITPAATFPANPNLQIGTIPFNIPNTLPIQEWIKIRNYAAHLSTNLIQICCNGAANVDEPLMDKEIVFQLCGAYYRHVRSIYLCNNKEALVDLVPKDSATIDNILKFSGVKYIKKHKLYISYSKAIYKVPMSLLGDYAAMLAWFRTANNEMNMEFFYPNVDWEPPVHMIPIVRLPAASYDAEVSSNCMREAIINPQGAIRPPKRIP